MPVAGKAPLRSRNEWLYVGLGTLCMVLPLAGFFPTYVAPIATARFSEPAILHVHAMFAFGWVALFVLQSSLVARGRVVRHEAIGLAGIALATGMCFTSVIVAVKAMIIGIDAGRADGARAFAIVPLSIIAMFAGFVIAAIATIKRPEYHKRLMLLATLVIMPPALIRLLGLTSRLLRGVREPLVLTATFGRSPANPAAGLAVGTVAAIAGDLLIAAAIAWDWRANGRPHRVYWVGAGMIVLVQVLRIPISGTSAWTGVTDVLAALVR